ncbi:MAG: putative lipoprotein [bacterium]|nr:putative lipoprotein [bacterium]
MRYIACALAAVVTAGCSSVQVRSTPAPNANLAQLRTFAFMTPPRPDSPSARLAQSPAGQEIRQKITQDLIEKGYQPAPQGVRPDFLVAFRGTTQQRTEVDDWGYAGPVWGWGWGTGWGGPDVTVRQYTEGTLIVDFVDPSSRQVLWRGTVTGVVNNPQNPNLNKVAKAVDKLMARYPSSQLASTARTRM